MRRLVGALVVLGVLAGCAGNTSETTTTTSAATTTAAPVSTTTAPVATTATTLASSTTTTTASLETRVFTVELLGLVPEEPFGTGTALGSGCSPGTDQLPDGVWFGWMDQAGQSSIDFDLACFYGARLEPAIQNESGRIRTLALDPSARVFPGGAGSISYDAWVPSDDPVWLFVNDREVTEIAAYDQPIRWAYSTTAWPEGMFPGCCDGGTVAPASPSAPWPDEGWPADGFYDVWIAGEGDGYVDVEIVRWYDCDDRPDLCAEWWVGDEVSSDPLEERLLRRIDFEEDLTVVIAPIAQGDDAVLVGDGVAYRDLLGGLQDAIEQYVGEDQFDGWANDPDWIDAVSQDPGFPFGPVLFEGDEIGYWGFRGPGGSMLSWSAGDNWWWHVLEVREGKPILYVHAGIIAG